MNFPERIPFRLTRDIEDGMGAFSIDGIFRRYAFVLTEITYEICKLVVNLFIKIFFIQMLRANVSGITSK